MHYIWPRPQRYLYANVHGPAVCMRVAEISISTYMGIFFFWHVGSHCMGVPFVRALFSRNTVGPEGT